MTKIDINVVRENAKQLLKSEDLLAELAVNVAWHKEALVLLNRRVRELENKENTPLSHRLVGKLDDDGHSRT